MFDLYSPIGDSHTEDEEGSFWRDLIYGALAVAVCMHVAYWLAEVL